MYKVTDPKGMHARPAGIMAAKAKEFESSVQIEFDGTKTDMKKILPVMGIPLKEGDVFTVNVVGDDEDAASEAIQKALIDIKF